jgi:hypothetical protein
MRLIPLTQDQVTTVDDCEFEKMNQFRWYAMWCSKGQCYYAVRAEYLGKSGGKSRTRKVYMHRQICGVHYGDRRKVLHRNPRETLDNRIENLRIGAVCESR